MNSEVFKARSKAFAVLGSEIVDELPRGHSADVIGRQLLRSASSVGANYRAACRARSKAEFIAKPGIVEEEADESLYWLELLTARNLLDNETATPLLQEGRELLP